MIQEWVQAQGEPGPLVQTGSNAIAVGLAVLLW